MPVVPTGSRIDAARDLHAGGMGQLQGVTCSPEAVNISPSVIKPNEEHMIADGVSTLVLRNLPRRLPVGDLLHYLDVMAPRAGYNFVLMPVDGQRQMNLCQCIVNFESPEAAKSVAKLLANCYIPYGDVRKRCKVFVAAVQGLELNLAVCALNLCFGEADNGRRMQMPLVFDSQRRPVDLGAAMRAACQGDTLKHAWLIHTKKQGASEPWQNDFGNKASEPWHSDYREEAFGRQVEHDEFGSGWPLKPPPGLPPPCEFRGTEKREALDQDFEHPGGAATMMPVYAQYCAHVGQPRGDRWAPTAPDVSIMPLPLFAMPVRGRAP